jgi:hypothetical protein
VEVLLEGATVESEGKETAWRENAVRRAQHEIRQRHRLPDPTAKREVELPNQRNAHEADPRDSSSDATGPRSNLLERVMREQVIGPLERSADRK